MFITVISNKDGKSKRQCVECKSDTRPVLKIRFKFAEIALCHSCAALAIAHLQEAQHNIPPFPTSSSNRQQGVTGYSGFGLSVSPDSSSAPVIPDEKFFSRQCC